MNLNPNAEPFVPTFPREQPPGSKTSQQESIGHGQSQLPQQPLHGFEGALHIDAGSFGGINPLTSSTFEFGPGSVMPPDASAGYGGGSASNPTNMNPQQQQHQARQPFGFMGMHDMSSSASGVGIGGSHLMGEIGGMPGGAPLMELGGRQLAPIRTPDGLMRMEIPGTSDMPGTSDTNNMLFSVPENEIVRVASAHLAETDEHATEPLICGSHCPYKIHAANIQTDLADAQRELKGLQKSVERYQLDLGREKTFRDEMEATLTQAVEESLFRANNLYNLVRETEATVLELQQENRRIVTAITSSVNTSVESKEQLRGVIDSLERENAQLMDLHSAHAQEMDNEDINLPNSVDELQLLVLKLRDDLIRSKVAKEHIEANLRYELNTCKQELQVEQQTRATMEQKLMQDLRGVQERSRMLDAEKFQLEKDLGRASHLEEQLKAMRNELVVERSKTAFVTSEQAQRISALKHANDRLDKQVSEQAARIKTLHESLETSEHVQMDFVRMNQELQMALERIRQEDTEVRWQFEDDVTKCHQCREPFSVSTPVQRRSGAVSFLTNVASGSSATTTTRQRSPKLHCRHCGKIFCEECLSRELQAGPNKRVVKVCDLCHTLLSKNLKPYFSERIDKQAAAAAKTSPSSSSVHVESNVTVSVHSSLANYGVLSRTASVAAGADEEEIVVDSQAL